MAHAKTDSEVTSIALSSPGSNHRPVYYVQSPSRDSHDGGETKTIASFHSTPAALSPMGSPHHSNSSVGRHSRESSASRFSGSMKRKILPNDSSNGGNGGKNGKSSRSKSWKEAILEEERFLEDDDDVGRSGLPRRCYYLAFVLGFFVLFSFFALILWGASRSQKPHVIVKSITFENFIIQAGTDASLVPTDMATLNSTVKLTFRNTATFFGVHVSPTPLDLNYFQLNLASGNINEFYQRRKSQRNLNIVVKGDKIPLYGGGARLTSSPGKSNNNQPVPLTLGFTIRSRAYVLGHLVKPKFYTNIQCKVVLDQTKLNKPAPLTKSCQYS